MMSSQDNDSSIRKARDSVSSPGPFLQAGRQTDKHPDRSADGRTDRTDGRADSLKDAFLF